MFFQPSSLRVPVQFPSSSRRVPVQFPPSSFPVPSSGFRFPALFWLFWCCFGAVVAFSTSQALFAVCRLKILSGICRKMTKRKRCDSPEAARAAGTSGAGPMDVSSCSGGGAAAATATGSNGSGLGSPTTAANANSSLTGSVGQIWKWCWKKTVHDSGDIVWWWQWWSEPRV